jgi:hypothetical protein
VYFTFFEAKSPDNILVPPAGFEPATIGLEVHCSIQLSYRGMVTALSQIDLKVSIKKIGGVDFSTPPRPRPGSGR